MSLKLGGKPGGPAFGGANADKVNVLHIGHHWTLFSESILRAVVFIAGNLSWSAKMRLPYRFFFAQALMRSSAFSIFSIELATLKRR